MEGVLIAAKEAMRPGLVYKLIMLPDTEEDQHMLTEVEDGDRKALRFQMVERGRPLFRLDVDDRPKGFVLIQDDASGN